jgi:uncharacterized RDD family membrane protein YckC
MQWTDDIRIETPEQIDVSLEVAGLGSRFVAWVLDGLIKVVVLLIVILTGLLLSVLLAAGLQDELMTPLLMAGLIAFFWFLLLGYNIYFEVRHSGRTLGKMLAGIRVIREGGGPVDFRSACIRNVLALVDFLPFFYMFGSILVLLSARAQRLGDLAAGTIVIRERTPELPGEPLTEVGKWATEDIAFTAERLVACTPEDRYILRSFFQRFRRLEPRPRRLLALRLARAYAQKTAYTLPAPLTDGKTATAFLASLYRDLEKLAQQDR